MNANPLDMRGVPMLDLGKGIHQTSLLVISFSNGPGLVCWHTSIAIISSYLNGSHYCFLTFIILFHINNLLAHSEVVASIAI